MGKNRKTLAALIFVLIALAALNLSGQVKLAPGQCATIICADIKNMSVVPYVGQLKINIVNLLENKANEHGIFVSLISLFAVLLIAPLAFAFRELFVPRDIEPQLVDLKYLKDGRYFEKSFEAILQRSLGSNPPFGLTEVMLSKKETVEVTAAQEIEKDTLSKHIMYVKGDLTTQTNVVFDKEIYCTGDVLLGANNTARVVASKGSIALSKNTKILRWIGCDENITVAESCSLGARASCGKEFTMHENCLFKFVNANVMTFKGKDVRENVSHDTGDGDIGRGSWCVDKKRLVIPDYSNVEGDIVSATTVEIKRGTVVNGSIKTHGDLLLEDSVRVKGNIFCGGNIHIGKKCFVEGDIVGQKGVYIYDGCVIGLAGRSRSVMGKRSVDIYGMVIVNGYVLTEGVGRIF